MTRNKRTGSNPRVGARLGTLGEKLLAAGLVVASSGQGRASSSANAQTHQQSKDEVRLPEVGERSTSMKRPRSKKQRKQKAKATGSKKAKQKKDDLLLIIERQKKRKEAQKGGVSSIFDDEPKPVPVKAPEHRYSVRKVQDRLRTTAKHVQALSGHNEVSEFTASDRENIRSRLSAFEDIYPLLSFNDDADIELVIGFDFGSTSSKVVCRFPYDEGLGAFAVPNVGSLSAEGHPYYWRTLLWEDEVGAYSLTFGPNKRLHDHLKLTFLRSSLHDGNEITKEMLHVTAYLALMIRQSLGWLWLRVGRAIGQCSIGLSVNFGFPTETGGRSPRLEWFQKCADIALRVAISHDPITYDRLRNVFDGELGKSGAHVPRTLIVPEFIGAVMGYFHSAQKRNGQFMICDIGGLTVDAVCFGFYQAGDGDSLIKIYGSSVAPYGAEIARIALDEGIPQDRFSTAIGSFLCDPIRDSYAKTSHSAPVWGGALPLFVIGGGRHHEGFLGAFSEAERLISESLFRTSFSKIELDLSEELDVSEAKGRSCGRLMVAWGLSHSDLDLPEWLSRIELSDGQKLRKSNLEDIFVGKEQT